MKVDKDNRTYDVYFPEDAETLTGVSESRIKAPITSGKTANSLSKYTDKVFFDPGSDGKDPEVPYFQAGEFRVIQIMDGNKFLCQAICDGDERVEVFDIGHVIRRIRKYEEE